MRKLITELDDNRLDNLLSYVPDYSEANANKIKRKFLSAANTPDKAALKKSKRIIKVGLIAAALCVLSVATALAVVLGDINFGEFLNRGGERWEDVDFISIPMGIL